MNLISGLYFNMPLSLSKINNCLCYYTTVFVNFVIMCVLYPKVFVTNTFHTKLKLLILQFFILLPVIYNLQLYVFHYQHNPLLCIHVYFLLFQAYKPYLFKNVLSSIILPDRTFPRQCRKYKYTGNQHGKSHFCLKCYRASFYDDGAWLIF